MVKDLNVFTLNAQGLRNRAKRHRLYEWMKNQNFGVIFLQETHFTVEICTAIENALMNCSGIKKILDILKHSQG